MRSGARLVVLHHQRAAGSGTVSNEETRQGAKNIGAAKSSINEACDGSSGCTSKLLLLCHLSAQQHDRG